MSQQLRVRELILVPALISLGITLLRLTGELLEWSPFLFNPAAGGGGAPIGISWLIPVFGIYFCWKLLQMNIAPESTWKTLGVAVGGLLILMIPGSIAVGMLGQTSVIAFLVFGVCSLIAIYVTRMGWKELHSALLQYALLARIPVVVIMFFAILGNWGTHYDVPPNPDFPEMGALAKWLLIGLLPQMTMWIALTVVAGMLFAVPVLLLKGAGKPAASA